MGALKSVTYEHGTEDGADVYLVRFEHGQAEWTIGPLSADGKVQARSVPSDLADEVRREAIIPAIIAALLVISAAISLLRLMLRSGATGRWTASWNAWQSCP